MKKILVIEDEPEMRRNITTLLRYYDYEPVAAENGRVAVEMARREKPDLILCDVMMPELTVMVCCRHCNRTSRLRGFHSYFSPPKARKMTFAAG